MKQEFQLCIIVPAYNEESKFDTFRYKNFLSQHEDVSLVFVNDASVDNTLVSLEAVETAYPNQVKVLSNPTNAGKATSVLNGMQYALEHIQAPKYAFLDADLATSLEECLDVSKTVKDAIQFTFGSRILTADANIQRKAYRHYIGRFVATAISNTLKLAVYDTQCGCKVFTATLGKRIFREPFISRWLFDVELFFRTIELYGRQGIQEKIHEYPLKQWVDAGDSKVKFSYFFKLWLDLWKIRARYRKV